MNIVNSVPRGGASHMLAECPHSALSEVYWGGLCMHCFMYINIVHIVLHKVMYNVLITTNCILSAGFFNLVSCVNSSVALFH